MKTVDFSETIAASDLKVGRCRQLIEFMKLCEYRRSRSFLYHIFSRFCMSCAKISGVRLQDHWSSCIKSVCMRGRGGGALVLNDKVII